MAAAFHIATLADPDADRTGAPGAPDDARFVVSLDGTTLAPGWTGWRLTAVCRPWRAPGPPAHGPAVAIEAAGGPLWAEVVELAVWRDGCPLRLTQATRQGQLRRSLHGIEEEDDPAAVAGFLRSARRLLTAATAAVGGGRPRAFESRERFKAVVGEAVRRVRRRGRNPSSGEVAKQLRTSWGQVHRNQLLKWCRDWEWPSWEAFLSDVTDV